jgi:hypothetical protein
MRVRARLLDTGLMSACRNIAVTAALANWPRRSGVMLDLCGTEAEGLAPRARASGRMSSSTFL